MESGEGATLAWVVDIRITGDRGGSPRLLGPLDVVWGGLAQEWPSF